MKWVITNPSLGAGNSAMACSLLLRVWGLQGTPDSEERVGSRAEPDLPWLAVDYAEVKLLNGDVFVVEGMLDEVEAKLSDAARSGQSRLAWFTEHGTDGSVGINPAQVASLKVSEIAG
jgi:hypothetical protein